MPSPNLIEIESVHFEGYLEKQRKLATWAWNKYWFMIEDGQLNYYKDETLTEGAGLIDLGQAFFIKPINNVGRNHSFEITMKDRSHIFCAESDSLRDQWVRYLQQARLLRPKRSSSMMRPRCNSIDEDCTPDQILSIEDLEPPDTPTSPPGTPNSAASSSSPPLLSSPPHTPTSPIKFGSPKFQKAISQGVVSSSPKIQRALPKARKNSKGEEFLDQPAWVKGKAVANSSSSEKVLLKGIRRFSESPVSMESPKQLPEKTYAVSQNSIFYVSCPPMEEEKKPVVKKKPPVMATKSNKLPVTRVFTGPVTSLQNTNNGYRSSPDLTSKPGQRVVSRSTSHHPVVSRSHTTRPVSAHLTRARPVSGERPVIENRASAFKSCTLSTSSDSDSESPSPNRKLGQLSNNRLKNNTKAEAIPSKSSTGQVVLRRNLRVAKSMPLPIDSDESSDNDTDKEAIPDEVFESSPMATSSPVYFRFAPRVMEDEYYEKLNRVLREPRPPIPELTYPRLELTFRSAFDDIRLFLANNREDDEIFPVPRKSERGGKAIKKLKKLLGTLS